MASVLVLSDTHFGLDSSTLADHRQVDFLIWEIWRYGKGCEEIILLGDILDLWRSRPEKAMRDARYFFEQLSDLGTKISYVVGNHDHHLAIMRQENDFLGRASRGEIYSVFNPSMCWNQTIAGLNVDMYYPIYRANYSQRSYLFTHGHHLNGFHAFSIQIVEQLRSLSREETSPADLELMMAYVYESMYRSSYIGEMVNFEDKLWKISNTFGRLRGGIMRNFRHISVKRQYEAIVEFMRSRWLGAVDCFVYGDTHRAGIYRGSGGPLAVNAGSLTSEIRNGSPEELPDTYMLIDDDCVAIRQMGREKPLYARNFD